MTQKDTATLMIDNLDRAIMDAVIRTVSPQAVLYIKSIIGEIDRSTQKEETRN